jgi:Na+-translocating ferredoxin:NAD+ oxidoreductase RnfG subunit
MWDGDKLPSTIASHIYTMVALAVICALLVATLNAYTTTLKNTSEIEQLKNLLNQVAAKGSELLTMAAVTKSQTQAFLQLPAAIGYQQYWIRAANDSARAWMEGSLGEVTEQNAPYQVFLLQGISASGHFVGGYGPAVLESHMNGSTPQLKLGSLGG